MVLELRHFLAFVDRITYTIVFYVKFWSSRAVSPCSWQFERDILINIFVKLPFDWFWVREQSNWSSQAVQENQSENSQKIVDYFNVVGCVEIHTRLDTFKDLRYGHRFRNNKKWPGKVNFPIFDKLCTNNHFDGLKIRSSSNLTRINRLISRAVYFHKLSN